MSLDRRISFGILPIFRCLPKCGILATSILSVLPLLMIAAAVHADTPAASDDATASGTPPPAAKPNILWIMSEDNSKHYLQHFDESGVSTPAIEAMAAHGVTFDRAFSNAPVCSVARTTLIMGCYAPRIGGQYHRAINRVSLPEDMQMFPAYLRSAGYYTTNNSKTDYNVQSNEKPWDESSKKASWQNRPDSSTPFFHVQSHADSHESRLHFAQQAMEKPTEFSQDDVRVPPYLPETKLTRFTAAYYRDRISKIDEIVEQTIADLEAAGQLENTFVFYFGDHGGVLPRSKGYVFETGLHVPLVVRVPEKYRDLVDRDLGSRTRGFVSFIDFAPTVLRLAGVETPDQIDGRAFLGEGVTAADVDVRDTTFSYADRMDEKYDLVRAVRLGDWKYIRYFEAQYPNSLHNEYRYKMLAYQQWRQRSQDPSTPAEQLAFFQSRPVEALFNLSEDPDEVNNLASETQHGGKLTEMRRLLSDHLKDTHDLSFVPEAVFLREGTSNPVQFGDDQAEAIATYIDTVNIALEPWDRATTQLITSMNSGDPWVRYWAFDAASSKAASDAAVRTDAADDQTMIQLAQRATLDPQPLVAARAAEFLAIIGEADPREVLVRSALRSRTEAEVLQILNIASFFHDNGRGEFPIDADAFEFKFRVLPKGQIARRLRHFSEAQPADPSAP
ncbi:sulfatase family protein [Allorhodopirellula solitaria]|uniref:Sulfatase n=1 Tax=Allorhodopirellula solitaria TaxID=2527987 RepID=A0A5C5XQ15_9BACT|nr:sulfatase [Allorhodopirellula solitaria]TWT65277.1 Sulfatase [Allorhodopirellula solitaria]